MGALKDLFLTYLEVVLTGYDDMLTLAIKAISEPIDGNVWGQMVRFSNALKPFCYLVIGLCTCIELAQTASKVDMLKWEHALKTCIKLCLAYVCIDVSPTLLKACFVQSQAWISALDPNNVNSAVIKLGTQSYSQLVILMDEIQGFSVMGLWIALFIMVLAVMVCALMVQVIAYGRMFEIYVYLVVSPLPFAFLPLGQGDNFSRITTRFMKNFIAVCLQGVMMLISIQVFNIILGNTISADIANAALEEGVNEFSKVFTICFKLLIGSIALLMAVTKSGTWAKNIMDAA